MELEFIARNTELTPAAAGPGTEEVRPAGQVLQRGPARARLTVTQEKHRISVEAYIRGKDFEVEASSETPEWTTSLQEVVEKLEQQARE